MKPNETEHDSLIFWTVIFDMPGLVARIKVSTRVKKAIRESFDEWERTNADYNRIPRFISFLDIAGATHELPIRGYAGACESTPASRRAEVSVLKVLREPYRVAEMIDGDFNDTRD